MQIVDSLNLNEEINILNSNSNSYYLYKKTETEKFPIILEMKGPINTPYEGGVFFIEINENNIKFITKICSIFVNFNTGEILDLNLISHNESNNKIELRNIVYFIQNEILISPNTTKLIEERLNSWSDKEIYFNYLIKIKSFTKEYANKDGIKIKVDNILLSNNDISKYENKKDLLDLKKLKRFINEIKIGIPSEKSDYMFFCPFNNFNQIYFEFKGELGTPYEGGVYQFLYELSNIFPFKFGKCIFRTKIFHNKFNKDTSNICDVEIDQQWSVFYKFHDVFSHIYKIINKYDLPCKENSIAKELIKTDFNQFLKESKNYTKKYANVEGIKFKPNLSLIEKSVDELKIEKPKEKDYMIKIEKEFDKNIKEENIEINFKWPSSKPLVLNVRTTDFVLDICQKIREYLIEHNNSDGIDEYKNLLPKIISENKGLLNYNKQIGSYEVKNGDTLGYYFNFPTCNDYKFDNK